MTTILHIDSSILGQNSVSRSLSAEIVSRLSTLHPDARVIRRDLISNGPRQLSDAHLAAWQGNEADSADLRHDLEIGYAYIEDLRAADLIVVGAPMYNFSISSQLKSWIDRILVAGRTFRYTADGPQSLLPPGKRVFIASARGGVYSGDSPSAALDHQERYLLGVLGFLGLADVTVIRAEGVALGDRAKSEAIAKAKAEIDALPA